MIPDALLTGDALVEDKPRGPAAERVARLRPPAHVVPVLLFMMTAVACFSSAAGRGRLAKLGKAIFAPPAGHHAKTPEQKQHMLRRRELLTGASEPMSLEKVSFGQGLLPGIVGDGSISYVHLWVSEDGMTHLADCTMKALDFNAYMGRSPGQSLQIVSSVNTSKVADKEATDWRHASQPQFVVTLAGTWRVNATDGSQRVLPAGAWLYQDDTERHPVAEKGTQKAMHASKALAPCSQLIVKWEREPVIGQKCPF